MMRLWPEQGSPAVCTGGQPTLLEVIMSRPARLYRTCVRFGVREVQLVLTLRKEP